MRCRRRPPTRRRSRRHPRARAARAHRRRPGHPRLCAASNPAKARGRGSGPHGALAPAPREALRACPSPYPAAPNLPWIGPGSG
ncbi:hypothetical protein FXW78_54100 [Rhodococcus opacus]|nr:hypothetical protein [Rhodococcus opacus]